MFENGVDTDFLGGTPSTRAHLPRAWDQESRRLVSMTFSNSVKWPAFVDALRGSRFPSDVLPLAPERSPFASLPYDLVDVVARRALLVPEISGRLTEQVRRVAGFERIRPTRFCTIEAHIDLSNIAPTTLWRLIELGFEPDDLAPLVPAHYAHLMTMQFVAVPGRSRTPLLHRLLRDRVGEAIEVLAASECLYAYIESEVYSSAHRVSFEPRLFDPTFLIEFPLRQVTFHYIEPLIQQTARRAADIHIKIRLSAVKTHPALHERLLEAGFYCLTSHAGNSIYNLHFRTRKEARRAFGLLCAFFRLAGGVDEMTYETCTALWQKVSPEHELSPLPPEVASIDFQRLP